MSENCSHDCGSCSADCSSRSPQSMIEQPNKESRIDKVIGVVSGKGGVGKSMISSMLAVNLQRKGHRTAIMDADVTGPSIPKAFGITGHAVGTGTAFRYGQVAGAMGGLSIAVTGILYVFISPIVASLILK